ncbi:hypothetical protein D5086_004677 [Populus alba]|uniref:Uncharacterized protein n=1 Tax=Populus alba TaxID=43335 RepID=A0ACC4CSH0_POPAL
MRKKQRWRALIRRTWNLRNEWNSLSMEAGAWQQRARYNENMINALKFNIQQVHAQSRDSREGCGDSEVDDTASCYNDHAIDFHLLCKDNNDMKELMICKARHRAGSRSKLLAQTVQAPHVECFD